MHWVKATAPDGRPAWVNLAANQTMMRHENETLIFLGGIAEMTNEDGSKRIQWAHTRVKETPEELLNLPKAEPGHVPVPAAAKPSTRATVESLKPPGVKRKAKA